MSADASLTRLSPSRITITRRGTGSRDTIAAAATASGGETIAPSATATAHGMPGKSARAVMATAAVVASTSPIASSPIGATVRAEVAQRREERRRPQHRRQEDEEDEVRIQLRDRDARQEPDEETGRAPAGSAAARAAAARSP